MKPIFPFDEVTPQEETTSCLPQKETKGEEFPPL